MKRRLMRVLSRTRRDRERELDEEIEAHIQMRAEDLVARGMPPAQARAEAEARFGDVDSARRRLYAAAAHRDRRLHWSERIASVKRDAVLAVRRMRDRPANSLLTLGIFALAIGLTTSMFTVVDHVLLRALPLDEPERLVELQSVPEEGDPFSQVSMGNWYDWNEESELLEHLALYRDQRAAVALGTEVVRVDGTEVGGSFFEALRLPMRYGRAFTRQDADSGAEVVVVSEEFWRRWQGDASPSAESTLRVDTRERQVIGVVADGAGFPQSADVWIPMGTRPRTGAARNNINFQSLARMAPGATIETVRSEMDGIARGIRQRDPEGIYSFGVGVRPLREAVVSGASSSLTLLMAAVLVVLLVACVNLMGLGLAQGRERADEIAVRLALGGSRRRVMRQLVTEQVLMGVLGGVLGLGLAWWGTQLAISRLAPVLPRADEVVLDLRVAAVGLVLAVGAGLLAGLLPAWKTSARAPSAALSRARTVRGGKGLPGAGLVVAEIALTVLLLAGGALLVRSFGALLDRELGFEASGVVTLDTSLATPEYFSDADAIRRYWTAVLAELAVVPGVESVAIATGIPTGQGGKGFIGFPDDPDADEGARYRVVSENYFATMGTPVLAGRTFGPEDDAGSERVVVITRAMADTYWPDQEAVGRRVAARSMESYWHDGVAPWLRVIGVVEDVRHYGFEDDPEPTMYTLYRQIPQQALAPTAVVRVRPSQNARVVDELEAAMRAADPSLAVETGFLDQRLNSMLIRRRVVTWIATGFAITALVLAAMGLYGLLAYAVASRTGELAVRAALGAGSGRLVAMVVRGALAVVAVGAAVGVAIVALARGLLAAQLVEVQPGDPVTWIAVTAVLLGVAALAVAVPALRAARMDPMKALRAG